MIKIKRRNRFCVLIFLAFTCCNINAQKIVKLPFHELIVENHIIFNDSITFKEEKFTIFNCDSLGMLRDTTTGIYLFDYGEYKFILDTRDFSNHSPLNCLKIEIKKMKDKKWATSLSRKEKKGNRRLHITNRCTAYVSTTILIKRKLHIIKLEKF